MGCACIRQDVVVKNQKLFIDRGVVERENNEENQQIENNNQRNDEVIFENNIHRPTNQNVNSIARNIELLNQANNNNNEPFLQSRNNSNFNFPEIEDKFIGEGLKKMKEYISPINKEELARKRADFWGTRTEGNVEVWQFLEKVCCSNEFDEDILSFLTALDIRPYKECINICFDNAGAIYEIPNYCIHEPCNYNILTSRTYKNRPKEEIIKFKIRMLVSDISVECKNICTVLQLKSMITTIQDFQVDRVEIIRLFYGGKELQNIEELWNYNIGNGSIVQLMLSQ